MLSDERVWMKNSASRSANTGTEPASWCLMDWGKKQLVGRKTGFPFCVKSHDMKVLRLVSKAAMGRIGILCILGKAAENEGEKLVFRLSMSALPVFSYCGPHVVKRWACQQFTTTQTTPPPI